MKIHGYQEEDMFGLGITELVIILVIIVLLFGASRLPEVGRGVGEAIKNFKKSMSDQSEIDITPERKDKGNSADKS
jgi:sec-independent protein translocase protein TatA